MKIHIVGLGNLGLFLARHFIEAGFQVSGWDIDSTKQHTFENLGGSWMFRVDSTTDIVILAVFPEQITRELLQRTCSILEIELHEESNDPCFRPSASGDFWDHINPKLSSALLVNVSSVQQSGINALLGTCASKEQLFSFHPLFGPVAVTKSGWAGKQLVVTIMPEKDSRASALLETFTRKGVTIDHMKPEEHDRKMLPHALAFLIGELVKTGAEDADPRFLTGSGRQMLGLLDFTEAASLKLRHLILSNPELKVVVPKLKKVLENLSVTHGW